MNKDFKFLYATLLVVVAYLCYLNLIELPRINGSLPVASERSINTMPLPKEGYTLVTSIQKRHPAANPTIQRLIKDGELTYHDLYIIMRCVDSAERRQ